MSDISVIIPTYNRADRLDAAIGSVLRQTRLPGEIVVVDDGSTDHTAQVIDQRSGGAPVPIRSMRQVNRGPAAARNRGIGMARLGYLAFLDSDDQWLPEKLATQYHEMRSNPEYLVSHTRERWMRNGQHLNQKKYHRPNHGVIFTQALRLCCVGMSTVMARQQLFSRYGLFDETLRCCEDYDLWLRVSPFEPFLLVEKQLTVKHGGRPDQVSQQFRVGMDRFRIQALARLINTSPLSSSQRRKASQELQRRCMIYARGCVKHGKADEAGHYLQLAQYHQSAQSRAGHER